MESKVKIMKNFPYYKYRWFVTSSGKLVVGGKSAEQNEELVRICMEGKHLDLNSITSIKEWTIKKKKYVVMHTKSPGSPFSIILDENPNEKDLEETAIFTAFFSRAWKSKKDKTQVDVFLLEQMYKNPEMNIGTFGVMDTIDHRIVRLRFYFKKQLNVLRAVPFEVPNSPLVIPGNIPKEQFAKEISKMYNVSFEEAMNCLPTGSFDFEIPIKRKIIKNFSKNSKKK
ncbi:MAG: NFACT RNA binding domain-containing protein [Candidatus Pacearchaeota archaeon]